MEMMNEKTKPNNFRKMRRIMQDIGKTVLGSSLFFGGTLLSTAGPLGMAVGVPAMAYGGIKALEVMAGIKDTNSLFKVYTNNTWNKIMGNPNNYIAEDPTALLEVGRAMFDKNKFTFFIYQGINLFSNLNSRDGNNKPITYTTKSHDISLDMFREMEKRGFISNLKYEEAGKSKMVLAKLMIGNTRNLSAKRDFYNMSFNRTDKAITEQELAELSSLLGGKDLKDNYQVKFNKDGSLKKISPKINLRGKAKQQEVKKADRNSDVQTDIQKGTGEKDLSWICPSYAKGIYKDDKSTGQRQSNIYAMHHAINNGQDKGRE